MEGDLVSDMEDLKERILSFIKSDVPSADLTWTMFMCALHNYRCDTILRPFPSDYLLADGEKDFQTLRAVAKEVPNLKMLLQTGGAYKMSDKAWCLLENIFLKKNYVLSLEDISKFKVIQDLSGHASYELKPSHIFQVQYSPRAQKKFEEVQQSYNLIYAYHGSRLENFHSILNNGLIHADLSKNTLFGAGTYLSSDLSVSIHYSPSAKAWNRSIVGDSVSCVAVCEVIDHPDVKCQTQSTEGRKNNRSRAPDSMGGDVPDKYYVVTNSELVRVKYLLIFAEKLATNQPVQGRAALVRWARQHLFAIIIFSYIVVLLFVGLTNSRSFQSFYSQYFKKSRYH